MGSAIQGYDSEGDEFPVNELDLRNGFAFVNERRGYLRQRCGEERGFKVVVGFRGGVGDEVAADHARVTGG